MTFGFFSGRGLSKRLVSKIIFSLGILSVCRTSGAADTLPTSGNTGVGMPTDPSNDSAEDESFFEQFENLGNTNADNEGYESVVVGRRILVTDETSGFAETIDVTDASERLTSAADVLSRSAGVQVRKTGGVGSSAALSIRGSTSRQVPILMDGIEVGGVGSSAVDLGDFSLDLLDSVEVYRGSAPVSVGQSGIGGAVCLRTQKLSEPFTRTTASIGSYGTRRLSAGHGTPMGEADGLATFTVQHTDGDFLYFNDHGTLTNATDDRLERRINNHLSTYGALFKFSGPIKAWRWTAGDAIFAKEGGAPGIGNTQTKSASQKRMRNQLFGRFAGPVSGKARASLNLGYTRVTDAFRNPANEFNTSATMHTAATHGVPVGGLVTAQWKKVGSTDLSLDNRWEHLQRQERNGLAAGEIEVQPVALRNHSVLGLGHRWQPVPILSVDPAFRLTVEHSRLGDGSGNKKTVPFAAPSLGIKVTPLDWLTLRTGVGRQVRAPDLDELYGAFGSVEGNPNLDAETAINGDAGLTAAHTFGGNIFVKGDAAWFCSFAKDLIAYEQNSQNTIRPENIGKAVIQGVETGLRIDAADLFSLQTNYTYLYAVNRSDVPFYAGRRLPGRPVHQVYGKVEVGDESETIGGRLWLDADFTGETYLKQSNQSAFEVPARLFLGVGYRLSHPKSGTSLTLEVRNLLDRITAETRDGRTAPVADFTGMPLPGRSVFLTFAWKG